MKIITQNIGVVAASILIIVAAFIYNSFFKSIYIEPVASSPTELIGTEALNTLKALQAVSLQSGLLSSSGYLLLNDYSIPVPVLPVGRNNPFADIGR